MIDKWASEFWGKRIFRGDDPDCDCACILLPATDQAAIQQAEEFGAKFMDVRVELARATGPEVAISRPAYADDVDALASIARTAFRGLTRFYADIWFRDERCDDMYEAWLRSSCDGWAAKVLMVGDGSGPAGFVTIHDDGDSASIGLIAVAEHVRGQKMGSNLTRAAVNWAYRFGFPRITVVTQGANVPAQRAFQSAGFVTESTDIWLHKWYG